ncbi:MAG: transposase [Turicibacter sp.]|nr:transposase [Turicibacter sp.]
MTPQSYFKRYTPVARTNLKHIVIDMYAPYISLIQQRFLYAKIISFSSTYLSCFN